jgi:hypothetical protein
MKSGLVGHYSLGGLLWLSHPGGHHAPPPRAPARRRVRRPTHRPAAASQAAAGLSLLGWLGYRQDFLLCRLPRDAP